MALVVEREATDRGSAGRVQPSAEEWTELSDADAPASLGCEPADLSGVTAIQPAYKSGDAPTTPTGGNIVPGVYVRDGSRRFSSSARRTLRSFGKTLPSLCSTDGSTLTAYTPTLNYEGVAIYTRR
jgi:hypothetical protein